MDDKSRGLSGWMIAAWMSGGTALVTLLLVVADLLQPGELTPSGLAFLRSPSTLSAGYWIACILAVVLLFSALTIWVRFVGESRATRWGRERSDLEQELLNTKAMLADTERLMVTDPITGIPNYRSWQRHAAAWPRTRGARRPSCLVLVDLDRLGALNEISHECANRVLGLFATRTYHSMRRNEHAFKIPDKDGPFETERQVRMFRHYAGGDEFCFHMLDEVMGTIGFVNRLRESCEKYEEEIKDNILPDFMSSEQIATYRLQFCAAIVPIKAGVPPDAVMVSALQTLTNAKKHSTSRILVQFDPSEPAKTLSERKADIEQEIRDIDTALSAISDEKDEDELGDKARRLKAFAVQRSDLEKAANMLGRLAPLFAKRRGAVEPT
jgi:GGDEF domain-containing protein